VAFTRARDYLVLPTFFRGSNNCLFSDLEPSFGMIEREAQKGAAVRVVRAEELEFAEEEPPPFLIPGLLRPAGRKASSPGIERRDAWIEERRLLLERAGRCVEIVSPSRLPLVGDERDFVPEKLFTYLEVEGYRELSFAERRRIALGFGSAVHAVLEYLDFDQPSEVHALSRWASRAAGVESLGEKVAQLVTSILSLEVFARARRGRYFREYPVSAWEEGRLIQGTMDLVIEEADGLTIIDYKTDFVEGDGIGARAEHYRPQIEAYARALEAATGKKVKEASLLFLIPRTLVPLLPSAVH
jgi:ATP-dependent exoDNAse (exonuclease V) beta subunit